MEAEAMFPGVSADGLLVVPTCQVRGTARADADADAKASETRTTRTSADDD